MKILSAARKQWTRRAAVRNVWVDRAALAAAVVALVRMGLMAVPEPVPGLARTGELLYDLCIALIGAWIFNLLVIEAPAIRRRETLLRVSAHDLEKIANKADLLYEAICRKKLRAPSSDPAIDEIRSVCASVRRDSRAPFYIFRDDLTSDTLDWIEYIERHLDDARDARARLMPALVYLDWEVVAKLSPLSDTPFERFIRMASRHGFVAPNLEELAEPLHEYLKLSRPLQNYLADQVRHA